MGLLTVDVSPLGIVIASDSQSVDLFEARIQIYSGRPKAGSRIVRVRSGGFSGFAGYVGTESIGGRVTRDWLRDAILAGEESTVGDLCGTLADELTRTWTRNRVETHLSIFVAGYEDAAPVFWFVSNGELPDGRTKIRPSFEAVNDLGGRFYGRNARPGESLPDLVARTQPSFRRGVMHAVTLFDQFTNVVRLSMTDQPQIVPIDSLARHAAYVKFRFEFTKRMYDPKYGIGTDSYPPVAGEIHVFSVDGDGNAWAHGKHVVDMRAVP